MSHILGFDNLSQDVLLFGLFFVIAGSYAVGYVTDVVMGDHGFGPFGNSFLIALGGLTGFYAERQLMRNSHGDELMWATAFAAAGATVMLLTLGVVKHRIAD